MAGQPLETGMRLRGANEEVPLDTARGASFRRHPREIAGVKLPTYFVHPPYKQGKGYTYWVKAVDVPPDSELCFSIGMGELSPERSDGVQFEVHVADVPEAGEPDYRRLFQETTNQHRWLPQRVSLAAFSGRRVLLKFVADCGPQDNATTDHAYWGDVKIVKAGMAENRITPERRYMTWVNDRVFRSSFYYRHVQSDQVNLTFDIEGPEDVTIRRITAHAHPDAIYRVFEHGLVLANPSRRPYTFDLDQLLPGRQYRRIQATPRQDTENNNGRLVGSTVTLEERDALFLVRVK
jgi:hypothetical protein